MPPSQPSTTGSGTATPTMKIAARPVIVAIQVRRLDGSRIADGSRISVRISSARNATVSMRTSISRTPPRRDHGAGAARDETAAATASRPPLRSTNSVSLKSRSTSKSGVTMPRASTV